MPRTQHDPTLDWGSKTFEGWRHYGFQVLRGEQATGRNAPNKATFTRSQGARLAEIDAALDDGDWEDELGNYDPGDDEYYSAKDWG